jgi:hypothetical protein
MKNLHLQKAKIIWGFKVLGPQPTKREIVEWYERSKRSLNLRLEKRHPNLWPINEETYAALLRSVEDYFLRLKKAFNERLLCQKKKEEMLKLSE